MIVPKVARALGVLAALSLVGCVVDATGESDEEPLVGEASRSLTYGAGEDLAGLGSADLAEGELGEGEDEAEGEDEDEGQQAPIIMPVTLVNDVADPHPDPWRTDGQTEAPGSHD